MSDRTTAKLNRRIERARRKGRHDEAVALARQLCEARRTDADAWRTLAAVADAAGDDDLVLSAGFEAAKLARDAAVWCALADDAVARRAPRRAADAFFRAGDLCATSGDIERAVALFDRALEHDRGHHPSQRVRQLLVARLQSDVVASAPAAPPAVTWSPPDDDLESDIGPTALAYVLGVQPWPSALDEHPLLHVEDRDDAAWRGDVAELGEARELGVTEVVATQGSGGAVLYVVERGCVAISRARPDVRAVDELCAERPVAVDVGVDAGLASSVSMRCLEDSVVRVISRSDLRAAALRRLVRDAAVRAALSRSPLLLDADPAAWQPRAGADFVELRSGRLVQVQGAPPADLLLVVAGYAAVSVAVDSSAVGSTTSTFLPGAAPEQRLGFVSCGDVIGDVVAGQAPVTITAQSPLTALRIDRQRIRDLSPRAREALEALSARQRDAIAYGTRLIAARVRGD